MGFDAANRLKQLRAYRDRPQRAAPIAGELAELRKTLRDQQLTGTRTERAWRAAAPEAFALGPVVSSLRVRTGVLTVWLADASQKTAIERWARREGITALAAAGLSVQRVVVKRD